MNRQDAFDLLTEYTKSENLIKHALAVEAAMRYYARKMGEDEELWGIVGLIHDFDYERYPDVGVHAIKGAEILAEHGYPEEVVNAVRSHAGYPDYPAETLMEKTLFAVDELTGFIVAVALVRPSRQIADVKVSSVKKKMKDKAFARNVKREDIIAGAESLGISLDEHIGNVLSAMKEIAQELGL